jgi:mono/diheme cytochrome c family protein
MKVATAIFGLCCLVASLAGAARPKEEKEWPHDSRGVLLAIARAPASAREEQNPYRDDKDAVLAGGKLFREHCEECHGTDGRGNQQSADLCASDVQKATPGELEWLLRNGNLTHGMPSWSGLPPQRLWQIVVYIKTLR